MIRILLLILLECSLANIQADNFERIKKVLEKHNFQLLESFANDSGIDVKWIYHRDITNTYMEGIFSFVNVEVVDTNTGDENRTKYYIKFINSGNHIIYYQCYERMYVKTKKDVVVWSYKSSLWYKNDSGYTNLNDSFKAIYLVNIDSNYLFRHDIIFGYTCGFDNKKEKLAISVKKYIKKNKQAKLKLLLQTGNLELQLYALEGFQLLIQRGKKIDSDILFMIRNIKSKDAKYLTCKDGLIMMKDLHGYEPGMLFYNYSKCCGGNDKD